MPRLGDDFDRIERRLMQVFGVNPSLLSAGSSTQPYASSALQAEFLNQILRTFQNYLKKHFMQRALVVSEAQGHQDYEMRGQTKIEITEEVQFEDENGEKQIETRPKWLIPKLNFQTLDLRDEATERQFLQTLRTMGVPIPDQKLMVGIPVDISDWTDEYNDELTRKTIQQQEAKLRVYKSLHDRNLPIPPDLKMEVESALSQQTAGGGAGGMPSPPGGGPGPGGAPGEGIVMPPAPPGIGGDMGGGIGPGGTGGPVPGGGPPPAGAMPPGPAGAVPESSNERRPGMPRPSSVQSSTEEEEPATIPEEELHLSRNQELVKEDGKEVIVERRLKPKNTKRYSMVDPSDILDEDEDETQGN
jgi:hypothetical protein